MPRDRRAAAIRSGTSLVALTAGGGAGAWLLGRAVQNVSGNHNAPWIVGRASGITAYLLLALVVAMGLALSHPWRTRLRRPGAVTRIRVHAVLAVFALAFTALHITVLATDRYAGVGWTGALLPMGASYRPVPVTLGVIGLYSGLLSGTTAALAGRIAARVWWPLHKVSAAALVLVWLHGLLAGSDTLALLALYVLTGGALLVLAVSRYVATTPRDQAEVFAAGRSADATAPVATLRRIA
jgi:hypothetical protein